ncbi:MAG: MFS transporter [Acidimicrobiia bacterium]
MSGIDRPARSAAIPNLVGRHSLAAAYALWQVLLQIGGVAGPAVAGVLIAQTGLAALYWLDAMSFGVAFVFLLGLPPLPPAQISMGTRAAEGRTRSALAGLRFALSRQELLGIFLIDLDAMVLGMPRALFPAMSEAVFGGGAATYGLLSAAPGAGALVGAVSAGWVGRVRRQGVAVIVSVAIWGLAIAAFGVIPWLWAALFFLALAGAADVISAIFRNTILHTTVPDALRGRLSALQIAVVAGGPRLGDVEAGAVAALAGVRVSVVSGGLGCLAGVALVAWRLPLFRRYASPPDPGAGAASSVAPGAPS